jgi:hypothetical protein
VVFDVKDFDVTFHVKRAEFRNINARITGDAHNQSGAALHPAAVSGGARVTAIEIFPAMEPFYG